MDVLTAVSTLSLLLNNLLAIKYKEIQTNKYRPFVRVLCVHYIINDSTNQFYDVLMLVAASSSIVLINGMNKHSLLFVQRKHSIEKKAATKNIAYESASKARTRKRKKKRAMIQTS